MAANHANASFDRLIERLSNCIRGEGEKALLGIRVDARLQARIDYLAKRCNDAALTATERERDEYATYVKFGSFITILQTKVRARHFKIGDTIEVIAYRPAKWAPGFKDELGTEKLFQSLVGRRFKIKGFDQYGYIELRPTRRNTVWIEPELVKFVGASSRSTESKHKPSASKGTNRRRTPRLKRGSNG